MHKVQRACAVALPHELIAEPGVFRGDAALDFLGAQAVLVVREAQVQAVARNALELAALLPGVGVSVTD